jgi:hypothetical protein
VDDESEVGDDNDVPAPRKKARTPARSVSPQPATLTKKAKPLGEASENIPAAEDRNIASPFKVMKPLIVKKKSKPTLIDEDDAQPEKKKKRKLLGVQPAFQWDSIMNVSEDCRAEPRADSPVWRRCDPLYIITAQAGHEDRVDPPSRLTRFSFIQDSFAATLSTLDAFVQQRYEYHNVKNV